MNYKIELLIIKNRAKLEQMIREESDYNKIVKQSQRLDRYLNLKMRELVKQFSFWWGRSNAIFNATPRKSYIKICYMMKK